MFSHKAAFPDRGDFTANLLLLALVLGINLEENNHGKTLIGFTMSVREVKAQKTSMQSNIKSFPASSGFFGIHGHAKLAHGKSGKNKIAPDKSSLPLQQV